MGQIDDVAKCVTMDLKQPGNLLYLVGETRDELGGSHFAFVNGLAGGQVPTVDAEQARRRFSRPYIGRLRRTGAVPVTT